jgi:Fe-coproporphyrin III synthase
MAKDLYRIAAARTARFASRALKPMLLTLNVTDRCNYRCMMCDVHTRKQAEPELDIREIDNLFSDRVVRDLDVVRITGGEPFLREDIAEIFDSVRKNTRAGIICLTTNGSFPGRVEEFARKTLPSTPVLHFHISLDALDERQNAIRNNENSLSNALATIEILCRIRKEHNFHLGINQTVIAQNLDQIRPVSEFAKKHGMGHNIILGAAFHEGKNLNGAFPGGLPLKFSTFSSMSASDIEKFYEEVADIKRSGHFQSVRTANFSALLRDLSEEFLCEGGRYRLLGGGKLPSPPCMAFFTHLRVMPDGDVIACTAFRNNPAGNIRDKTMSEIWTSVKARDTRKSVVQCPSCWIECDIGPSIFHSGEIIKWCLRKWVSDPDFRRAYGFRTFYPNVEKPFSP